MGFIDNQANAHPRDAHIKFYDEYEDRHHIYRYDGYDKDIPSVTTRISKFWNKFDADGMSLRIANSQRVHDPNDIYYGMTQEQIKDKWMNNNAAELGTEMHRCIELYYQGKLLPEEIPKTKEFQQFLNYYNNFATSNPTYRPYRNEWIVYNDEKTIAGSIDMTYEDEYGNILIGDWKRVDIKKFYDSYRKKGSGPFKHLDDNKFNKYSMQLNVYRHLLETYYNKKVVGMWLCLFHPDQETYKVVPVPRMEKETTDFFATF